MSYYNDFLIRALRIDNVASLLRSLRVHLKGYQVTSLHEMFTRGLKTRANDVSVNLKVSAVQGKYLQDNYHGVFYAKAHNLVLELRKVFDEALSKVDVLLMPTKPMKARSLPPANLTIKGTSSTVDSMMHY